MEEALKNMLKQAHIIESEIEISGDKFTAIFKQVAKLPNTFNLMNTNNKKDIEKIIQSIVPGLQ